MHPSQGQFPISHVRVTSKDNIPVNQPKAHARYVLNKRYKVKTDAFGMTDGERHLEASQDRRDMAMLDKLDRMPGDQTHIKIRSDK